MIDPDADDTAPLLAALRRQGVMTSPELQAALGVSQPTVSRLLARVGAEVVALGLGKRRRYALPQGLLGAPARQPLHWVHEDGRIERLGTLTALLGDRVHVEVDGSDSITQGQLPWWLAPLRAEGFLGRALAQRLQLHGLAADPSDWTLPQQLFAALQQPDAPGAVVLGEAQAAPLPVAADAELDGLADSAAARLPAGSSAGGEQPKFLAWHAQGRDRAHPGGLPVLVKFSPPRGTPFGERWHDLLHLEHLALQLLSQHGVPVALPRVVHGARRTHLVSPRFDRTGAQGRLHVVPLWAVHDAFVPAARQHWAASCEQLEAQRRLPPGSAAQVQALRQFGHLIGNTDMHFGNLSLCVARTELTRGRFTLAPLYDMLPMRWRPDASSGDLSLWPFTPEPVDLQGPARPLAALFWRRATQLADLSAPMRALAAEMAARTGP